MQYDTHKMAIWGKVINYSWTKCFCHYYVYLIPIVVL